MCVCCYNLQYDRSVVDLSCCGFFFYIYWRYYINACVYFLSESGVPLDIP